MFFSKILRVFFLSVFIVVTFFIYPKTSNALRIDHFEQHAGGHIINCTENTTIFGFGQSSCFEDTSSKKSESLTLIQQDKEYSSQNSEKFNTERIIKNDKINSLPVGVVAPLALVGGLTPIYFIAKRLLQNKEIKALKERINILETIITKE